MNIHNVLTEGFFEKIRRTLGLSTKQEKILRKDKKLMKLIKDLNYDVSEFEKHAQDMFKDLGIKRKVNIKKYQVKDFL
tara:strand:+ start:192 stop:425 length:234 start_codon:yes stop_codon:yes gene_type:complete